MGCTATDKRHSSRQSIFSRHTQRATLRNVHPQARVSYRDFDSSYTKFNRITVVSTHDSHSGGRRIKWRPRNRIHSSRCISILDNILRCVNVPKACQNSKIRCSWFSISEMSIAFLVSHRTSVGVVIRHPEAWTSPYTDVQVSRYVTSVPSFTWWSVLAKRMRQMLVLLPSPGSSTLSGPPPDPNLIKKTVSLLLLRKSFSFQMQSPPTPDLEILHCNMRMTSDYLFMYLFITRALSWVPHPKAKALK